MNDSKELWLGLRSKLTQYDVRLGSATAQSYIHDPKHLVFHAARYKFVAKMLEGRGRVLEFGCGDGFGAPIVAQGVKRLICTDIDQETIADNISRHAPLFPNIDYRFHDFRKAPYGETVDAVYSVDVLEHIYAEEERMLLGHVFAALAEDGVAIIGTPNITADAYASEHSRTGHVNLKSHASLRALCSEFFANVFLFSMNDEVLHTGYFPMAHYLWALCAGPKRK
jgi:cyclopropane fatty-acyl-phospholipid synthase-like methyltransferase